MGENSAILYPKLLGALWLSFTHELKEIELKESPKNIMFLGDLPSSLGPSLF